MRGASTAARRLREIEVQPVQVLPHLARDLLADAAGVLAGACDAGGDRVGVRRMPEQELGDRVRAVLVEVLAEGSSPPITSSSRARRARGRRRRRRAGRGSSRAAAGSCPRRARRSASSSTASRRRGSASGAQHPGVLAAASLRGVDHERARAQRGARQPARHDARHPAGQHERPQVDVGRAKLVQVDRHRAEGDRRLGDERARVGLDPPAEASRSSAVDIGPISIP